MWVVLPHDLHWDRHLGKSLESEASVVLAAPALPHLVEDWCSVDSPGRFSTGCRLSCRCGNRGKVYLDNIKNLCAPLIAIVPAHLALEWHKVVNFTKMHQVHDVFQYIVYHDELRPKHIVTCGDTEAPKLFGSPVMQCFSEVFVHLHHQIPTAITLNLLRAWGCFEAADVGAESMKEPGLQVSQHRWGHQYYNVCNPYWCMPKRETLECRLCWTWGSPVTIVVAWLGACWNHGLGGQVDYMCKASRWGYMSAGE